MTILLCPVVNQLLYSVLKNILEWKKETYGGGILIQSILWQWVFLILWADINL